MTGFNAAPQQNFGSANAFGGMGGGQGQMNFG